LSEGPRPIAGIDNNKMSADSLAVPKRFSKQDFYRSCRLLHGWLSAFAFLLLCFFSITGILLNHPDWVDETAPAPIEDKFRLEEAELRQLIDADEPEELLADIAARKIVLKGAFSGGNQVGNEVFVRLQGVRGLTDLRASLITGNVSVRIEPAPPISILNELHRGERAGATWRLLIDAIAALLVLLSIVGYLIFLSLRFRLRTALILTVASALGIWGVFALAVA
jgi:uncharacterized protein